MTFKDILSFDLLLFLLFYNWRTIMRNLTGACCVAKYPNSSAVTNSATSFFAVTKYHLKRSDSVLLRVVNRCSHVCMYAPKTSPQKCHGFFNDNFFNFRVIQLIQKSFCRKLQGLHNVYS